LVLFLTRVLQQDNAEAANNVSKWTGTVYIFSLVGAFLSDSYWGRYKTCGLVLLSLSSYLFLIRPKGCGDTLIPCGKHTNVEVGLFYLSIYLVALGNGGYQPNIATFGADQFDEEDAVEGHSKVAFFSYFYLALNLGSLFSNTILGYFEDEGMWALGFWASAGSAFAGLVLFLAGSSRYRHFKPTGNPLARLCQVVVASVKKCRVRFSSEGGELYDIDSKDCSGSGNRKIMHTDGFKFLDKAAFVTPNDIDDQKNGLRNPWRLCPVTQVEEIPQYALIGASEVFMYVGQLEFFNAQAPDGLKSFGSALCMTSISLGNYVSSLLVTMVMKISTQDRMPGWIPGNLNKGHLDRFYFLLAALTSLDLFVYIACAKWYKGIKHEGRCDDNSDEEETDNDENNKKCEV
ncbi:Protein NRT1/ PTR FAMILY 7.3, partial [Linum perenne]